MTIEIVFEVNCDACGATHQEDNFTRKAELWAEMKEVGWKRRREFTWCPKCVEEGRWKSGYVDWIGGSVLKSKS